MSGRKLKPVNVAHDPRRPIISSSLWLQPSLKNEELWIEDFKKLNGCRLEGCDCFYTDIISATLDPSQAKNIDGFWWSCWNFAIGVSKHYGALELPNNVVHHQWFDSLKSYTIWIWRLNENMVDSYWTAGPLWVNYYYLDELIDAW